MSLLWQRRLCGLLMHPVGNYSGASLSAATLSVQVQIRIRMAGTNTHFVRHTVSHVNRLVLLAGGEQEGIPLLFLCYVSDLLNVTISSRRGEKIVFKETLILMLK